MEVEVEYDYTAEERDELTLRRGDIVTNVSQFEEGWYIGTFNGREGVFPDNFVRVIKSAPDNISQPKPRDDHDSHTNRPRTSPVSNLHSDVRQSGADKTVENGKNQGEHHLASPTPTASVASVCNRASDYVKVAYAYTPEQPDELELKVKDFLRVLSRDLPEVGWWRGVNLRTNKTGVFPDNFVKMADSNDPDFKRAISDLKMKTSSSSPQRSQNGSASGAKTPQTSPTSPHGSRRYESSGSKNDPRKHNSATEGSGSGDRRAQKQASSGHTSSVQRPTDDRSAGRTEGARTCSRGETGAKTVPKSTTNAASLSRVDPNRMSEMGTPRNINDLQRLVNDLNERLSAVAKQLESFDQFVEMFRREQREQADDIARQLQDFTQQLANVKSAQLNNQTNVTRYMKFITERMHSIMSEVDELRKAREGDAVDVNRIKKVIQEIDSRTMLMGINANGYGDEYDGHMNGFKNVDGAHNSCDPYPTSRSSKTPTNHR